MPASRRLHWCAAIASMSPCSRLTDLTTWVLYSRLFGSPLSHSDPQVKPTLKHVAATSSLVSSILLIFFAQIVFQLLKAASNPGNWYESPGSPWVLFYHGLEQQARFLIFLTYASKGLIIAG